VVSYNPYKVSQEEEADYGEKCHPTKMVPSLVLEDGQVMIESAAICMYLAEKHQTLLPHPDYFSAYFM